MTAVAEKNTTTKIISIFFPLKPLRNKFSNNFISIQIADFIPKLKQYTDKVILYKIDKERFYTFDLNAEKFDDTVDIVDNQTIVAIFSVDKEKNVDISSLFDSDFSKSINTIRVHRKKVESLVEEIKPAYIFYTINSTRLLNSIIALVSSDKKEVDKTKTYFILSANNAKRNIDPLKKAFSTEKICRMNYVSTIDLTAVNEADIEFQKGLKRKIQNSISL